MARKANNPATFWLRDPKATKPTPIHCLVSFDGYRVKVATPFKCLPAHWNLEKYRVRNVTDATEKDQINTYLSGLEKKISAILADLRSSGVALTRDLVRARVDAYINPVADEEKPKTLLDFIDAYIKTAPTRLSKNSGAKAGQFIAPNTIRRYITSYNGLLAFSKIYPRLLTFDNIDLAFHKAYTSWLTSKNYATNNVSKYIENVKTFMAIAVDEGYTTNIIYQKFNAPRVESENIYLTEEELGRIYNLDLSNNPRLDKVRDQFIFASWTGLRFSDFSTLQPEHFKTSPKGKPYIDLRQRKTGGRVVIPFVHEHVSAIRSKYNDRLPTGISNQKTNDYIKEICKLAEINSRELKHIVKGGRELVKTSDGWDTKSTGVEKWQLVTSHTARRSFASNMFRRGFPSDALMKITGHKKLNVFMKYVKATDHDLIEMMYEMVERKPERINSFRKTL